MMGRHIPFKRLSFQTFPALDVSLGRSYPAGIDLMIVHEH